MNSGLLLRRDNHIIVFDSQRCKTSRATKGVQLVIVEREALMPGTVNGVKDVKYRIDSVPLAQCR